MAINQVFGLLGSALVLIAYLPQIHHLIKEHCSAGISRRAYLLWLAAAVLLLVHAFMLKDLSFMVLQVISATATGVILIFAEKYKYGSCPTHAPASAQSR